MVPENDTGILRRTHLQFLTKFFSNFLILLAEVLILLKQCLNRNVVSKIQTNKYKWIHSIFTQTFWQKDEKKAAMRILSQLGHLHMAKETIT